MENLLQKNGLSLVIPFFNESKVLQNTLEKTWKFLEGLNQPFELILADDGSTDSSSSIAKNFIQTHPQQIQLVHHEPNQGRGSILQKAFPKAQHPFVAYIDADLEIDISYVQNLWSLLQEPKVSIVTGTKLKGSRLWHRKIATRGYNFLVRTFLHSKISDHQCGLKGFRREVLFQLLPKTKEKGWAWDTEILLLAQKEGYAVCEFPVDLQRKRKSTVALLSTAWMFVKKIDQFRKEGLSL